MDEGFDRLRALIDRALDLPPEDRRAFVERGCGDDPGLRAEAVALLEGLREDTFLSPAPVLRSPASDAEPASGDTLGRYRLVRVLGRGGMGTVYEAEQEAPRRSVALKVMGRSVRSTAARERFRYEAEVLGALRHPGIAQVYEAGIEPGAEGHEPTPWFAMELVAGASTLRTYADEQGLGERQRLEAFLTALSAVQHGHQKGVIHRDLKPDSILVDRRGRLKIIDFGVARVADPEILAATLRTQADEIVGTLAYMSPEQVSGKDVDTRSDIYALGVVLYELLTGTLPIDVRKTDFLTSARRIAEEPPRRPRALGKEMNPDLEAILLRALEKDPARRYESAAAMADDLRRYLAGEPVEARTVGAFYQLRLFARRNKGLVLSAAAVLLVTIAAAAISLDFALRSNEAEQAAQRERARFEHLYRAQFMQNVETISLDAGAIADLYGGARIALRMTRAAIARLEELLPSSAGDAEFRLQLADGYRRLARTLSDLASSEEDVRPAMEQAGARAFELVDEALARDPDDPEVHALRAALLTSFAQIWSSQGDQKRAAEYVEQAIAELEPAGAPTEVAAYTWFMAAEVAYHRKAFEQAMTYLTKRLALRDGGKAEGAGADAEVSDQEKANLAAAYHLRSQIHRRQRRFSQAEADLRRCIALREELIQRNPDRITDRLERAQAWGAMGLVMMALGRRAEIESWYQKAYEELGQLRREAPRNLAVAREYALAVRGMGQIENTRAIHDHPHGSPGRLAGLRAALAHYDEAIAVLRDVVARRPETAYVRDALALTEKMASFTRRIVEGQGDDAAIHGK